MNAYADVSVPDRELPPPPPPHGGFPFAPLVMVIIVALIIVSVRAVVRMERRSRNG